MKKYRGFEGEVPVMHDTLGLLRSDLQYRYPELYSSPSYRGPLQASKIATAQVSPLVPPPVRMVPPSPPTGWYPYTPPVVVAVPPVVALPPPVPGTGPVDVMQPDIFSDDYLAPSPESIGPTSMRGAGPAGDITGKTPDESVAFPYATNGAAKTGAGTGAEKPALGGAAIFAAIALFVLMGG